MSHLHTKLSRFCLWNLLLFIAATFPASSQTNAEDWRVFKSESGINVYDVTDFGAKGDGLTDDSAAFNVCWNAAAAVNGKVTVPPGTYVINGNFSVTGNVTIEGYGATLLITWGDAAQTPPILITGGVSIRGLTFDGNNNSNVEKLLQIGGSGEDAFIHECVFQNMDSATSARPLVISGTHDIVTVEGCTFKNILALGNSITGDTLGSAQPLYATCVSDLFSVNNCRFENINSTDGLGGGNAIFEDADAIYPTTGTKKVFASVGCEFIGVGKRAYKIDECLESSVRTARVESTFTDLVTPVFLEYGMRCAVEVFDGSLLVEDVSTVGGKFNHFVAADTTTATHVTVRDCSHAPLYKQTVNGNNSAFGIFRSPVVDIENCQSQDTFVGLSMTTNSTVEQLHVSKSKFTTYGNFVANIRTPCKAYFTDCEILLDPLSTETTAWAFYGDDGFSSYQVTGCTISGGHRDAFRIAAQASGNWSVKLSDNKVTVTTRVIWNQDDFDGVENRHEAVRRVSTLTDAVALDDLDTGDLVRTTGYSGANDGGGNTYQFDSASALTADGGFVIDVTSGGQLIAVDQTVAIPEQFGATGDGVTNDHVQFNAMAQACPQNIKLTSGRIYALADAVQFLEGTGDAISITCDGFAKIKVIENANTNTKSLFQTAAAATQFDTIVFQNWELIDTGNTNTNMLSRINVTYNKSLFCENVHTLDLSWVFLEARANDGTEVSDASATVVNCGARTTAGFKSAVWFKPNNQHNIEMSGCDIRDCARPFSCELSNATPRHAYNISVHDNRFIDVVCSNISGTNTAVAVHINAQFAVNVASNVSITDNYVTGFDGTTNASAAGYGILVSNNGSGGTIDGVTIKGNVFESPLFSNDLFNHVVFLWGCRNVDFSENKFLNATWSTNDYRAFVFRDVVGGHLSDNVLEMNATRAIYLWESSDLELRNNKLDGTYTEGGGTGFVYATATDFDVDTSGNGDPNGNIVANVGSRWLDSTVGRVYGKTTGTGADGWTPLGWDTSGVVNVKNVPHGAVGNGVTDDTAAFQSAITAAGVDGKIYVPNGTYILSDTLVLQTGQLLYGEHYRGCLLQWTAAFTGNAIEVPASEANPTQVFDTNIKGIFLNHDGQVAGTRSGIGVSIGAGSRISNCRMSGWQMGVMFRESNSHWFIDNVVRNNDWGVVASGNNTFMNHLIIQGGQVLSNGVGILLSGVNENIRIEGVQIEGSTTNGILCAETSPNQVAWAQGQTIAIGDVRTSNSLTYIATSAGTTGATAPVGTGTHDDGGVNWTYANTRTTGLTIDSNWIENADTGAIGIDLACETFNASIKNNQLSHIDGTGIRIGSGTNNRRCWFTRVKENMYTHAGQTEILLDTLSRESEVESFWSQSNAEFTVTDNGQDNRVFRRMHAVNGNDGVFNVALHPYNAAQDGSADATTAIQNALDDAAGLSQGGEVYVPAGTYLMSGAITVGQYTTLKGAGWRKSHLTWADATPVGDTIVVESNATVEGIRFSGPGYRTGTIAVSGSTVTLTAGIWPTSANSGHLAIAAAKYSVGTVSNTGTTLTLTGGTWPSRASIGYCYFPANNEVITVASRTSDTVIELSSAPTTALSGASYVWWSEGDVQEVASRTSDTVIELQTPLAYTVDAGTEYIWSKGQNGITLGNGAAAASDRSMIQNCQLSEWYNGILAEETAIVSLFNANLSGNVYGFATTNTNNCDAIKFFGGEQANNFVSFYFSGIASNCTLNGCTIQSDLHAGVEFGGDNGRRDMNVVRDCYMNTSGAYNIHIDDASTQVFQTLVEGCSFEGGSTDESANIYLEAGFGTTIGHNNINVNQEGVQIYLASSVEDASIFSNWYGTGQNHQYSQIVDVDSQRTRFVNEDGGEGQYTAAADVHSSADMQAASIQLTVKDGRFDGEERHYRMSASGESSISIDNHLTSSPEVLYFDQNEYCTLRWLGDKWFTETNTGSTAPD